MPEVSVVVELRVELESDLDPVALERAILDEGRRAGRELYGEVLRVLDRSLSARAGAKQRLEPRWIATLAGRIRVWRYRVRAPKGSSHPLDRAMQLGSAEASPALRECVCDLAMRLPYRQVAELVSRHTGEPFSAQSAWRVLQAEGARVRTEEGRLVESIFSLGEAPPEARAPELVVVEADGTYLASQREQTDRFEVKTGVFYTGKAPAGGRRQRRFRLLDKGCYATTADADRFGQGLAAAGFAQVGLHRARHVLFVHDGLDEYGETLRGWLPGAIHQVDHFHVAERVFQISGADPSRFARLRARAFTDPRGLARSLRRGAFGVDPERARVTAGYLDAVAQDLWGIQRLPRRLRRGRMHIVGSGVVEKHQDLLVKRRMKGWGMRWTHRGAEHLLALQARRFCNRWPTRWGVIAS